MMIMMQKSETAIQIEMAKSQWKEYFCKKSKLSDEYVDDDDYDDDDDGDDEDDEDDDDDDDDDDHIDRNTSARNPNWVIGKKEPTYCLW